MDGCPIRVDMDGCPIRVDMDGCPIHTSLTSTLNQHGWVYSLTSSYHRPIDRIPQIHIFAVHETGMSTSSELVDFIATNVIAHNPDIPDGFLRAINRPSTDIHISYLTGGDPPHDNDADVNREIIIGYALSGTNVIYDANSIPIVDGKPNIIDFQPSYDNIIGFIVSETKNGNLLASRTPKEPYSIIGNVKPIEDGILCVYSSAGPNDVDDNLDDTSNKPTITTNAANTVRNVASDITNGVTNSINNIGNNVVNQAASLGKKAAKHLNNITKTGAAVVNTVVRNTGKRFDKVLGAIGKIGNGALNSIGRIVGVNKSKNMKGGAVIVPQYHYEGDSVIYDLPTGESVMFARVPANDNIMYDPASDRFFAVDTLEEVVVGMETSSMRGGDINSSAILAYRTVARDVYLAGGGFADKLKSAISGVAKNAKSAISGVAKNAKSAISGVAKNATSTIKGVSNKLINNVKSVISKSPTGNADTASASPSQELVGLITNDFGISFLVTSDNPPCDNPIEYLRAFSDKAYREAIEALKHKPHPVPSESIDAANPVVEAMEESSDEHITGGSLSVQSALNDICASAYHSPSPIIPPPLPPIPSSVSLSDVLKAGVSNINTGLDAITSIPTDTLSRASSAVASTALAVASTSPSLANSVTINEVALALTPYDNDVASVKSILTGGMNDIAAGIAQLESVITNPVVHRLIDDITFINPYDPYPFGIIRSISNNVFGIHAIIGRFPQSNVPSACEPLPNVITPIGDPTTSYANDLRNLERQTHAMTYKAYRFIIYALEHYFSNDTNSQVNISYIGDVIARCGIYSLVFLLAPRIIYNDGTYKPISRETADSMFDFFREIAHFIMRLKCIMQSVQIAKGIIREADDAIGKIKFNTTKRFKGSISKAMNVVARVTGDEPTSNIYRIWYEDTYMSISTLDIICDQVENGKLPQIINTCECALSWLQTAFIPVLALLPRERRSGYAKVLEKSIDMCDGGDSMEVKRYKINLAMKLANEVNSKSAIESIQGAMTLMLANANGDDVIQFTGGALKWSSAMKYIIPIVIVAAIVIVIAVIVSCTTKKNAELAKDIKEKQQQAKRNAEKAQMLAAKKAEAASKVMSSAMGNAKPGVNDAKMVAPKSSVRESTRTMKEAPMTTAITPMPIVMGSGADAKMTSASTSTATSTLPSPIAMATAT